MNKKIFILLVVSVLFASCEDLLTPAIENNRDLDAMYTESGFAQGILANAYTRIPTNSYPFDEVATDDAVSNNNTNTYLKIATGQWAANINPTEKWRNCLGAIQYLNIFLANTDKVAWADDAKVSAMFNERMKGEAYALRAMYMYYLLKAHGGWSNGQLLGVPIITEPLNSNSDFNLPRATFEECMQMIYTDLSAAEALLPTDYVDITAESSIPASYTGATLAQYNRVYGTQFSGRVSGRIVKAIRAQAALLAASPAFADGNTTQWGNAADYAAQVLDLNNGINGLSATGYTWYSNSTEIDGLSAGQNPAEILWRNTYSTSSSLESDNLPPTLYGSGRINPTQNLVDAFPMVNGYPITDNANSSYSAATPYTSRDPRLSAYIVYNGSKLGSSNTTITLASGNDAVNATEKSTRTGYYLRKLLRNDVSYNSSGGSWNTQKHYTARIRYTELYLIYAEAANEAYGPDGKGTHNYSAREVIAAIRKRAGVGGTSDPYLASISSKEDMRTLIHNERRLELCFEGHRFWDLRRWKEDLTVPARGVSFTSEGIQPATVVEVRSYDPTYMYYGPVPYEETLKWTKLIQNDGWKK